MIVSLPFEFLFDSPIVRPRLLSQTLTFVPLSPCLFFPVDTWLIGLPVFPVPSPPRTPPQASCKVGHVSPFRNFIPSPNPAQAPLPQIAPPSNPPAPGRMDRPPLPFWKCSRPLFSFPDPLFLNSPVCHVLPFRPLESVLHHPRVF